MPSRHLEIVLAGPRGYTLGFVQGFLAGGGVSGEVLDAEAEGFDVATLREKLHEMLRPSVDTLHLVVPVRLVPAVRAAVAAATARDRRVAVRHERSLAGARFQFAFAVYVREHGPAIRSIFENLPDGVRLAEGSAIQEKTWEDGRGIEVYSPVHEYELSGEGLIEGDLTGVLRVHRACTDDERIRAGAVELVPEADS